MSDFRPPVPHCQIPLVGKHGAGRVARIDAQDLARVSQYRWYGLRAATGQVYAARGVREGGRVRRVYLHRELLLDVLAAEPTGFVDHANGDTLDNRRENLRLCTAQQNQCNRMKTTGASRFKGVSVTRSGRFVAQICAQGRRKRIGLFSTEEEAAKAYDSAARTLHGGFARLNYPNDGEQSALSAPSDLLTTRK